MKKTVVEYNKQVVNNGISIIFLNYGTSILIMLFAIVKIITSKKDIIKRLVPYILVVVNTGIIMLLITGGETRFVFSNIICAYPLFIFPFMKANENSNKKILIKNDTMIELLKYFVVGIISAIINIFAFSFLADKLSINYIIANIIAFSLGLITNYLLSKKYVFKSSSLNPKIEFIIYGIIGVVGLGLDTLIIGLLKNVGLINLISKIISTFLVFIWNYGARKIMYLIIKRRRK